MKTVLGVVLWALTGLALGLVVGGVVGGVAAWLDIRDRSLGWDGIVVVGGTLIGAIIGAVLGASVGTMFGVHRSRTGRRRVRRR